MSRKEINVNMKKINSNVDLFSYFEKSEIERSIINHFDMICAKYHNRPAISSESYKWDYRQLSKIVNRLASNILYRFGRANQNIALLVEHDAPMVAAILGALKSGKAYVPIDPEYPPERIRYMLKDSGAVGIVASDKTIESAQMLLSSSSDVLNLDNLKDIQTIDFPAGSPFDISYVLYTSGSTGVPKGVIQNNRNVLHFIRNYTNNLKISPYDRLTLLSSYSFDAAVMGIFGAILNGACLFPKSIAHDGFSTIASWLLKNEISIYHSTPTVFRYFIDSCPKQMFFQSVRLVVLGGEAVVVRDLEHFRAHFNQDCIMINGLGPTESTVTLQNFVRYNDVYNTNTIPVGYPVEDTYIQLLNEDGTIAENEGEIVFKSEHVALGYLNLEEVTKKVFYKDDNNPKLRCYKTGDLGRWLPDGKLEFLGRKDFQVKIHGVRIELEEIESVINSFGYIKESVVVPRKNKNGRITLAAYFVLKSEAGFSTKELRKHLQHKLPSSMCPSKFIQVDRFKLTPTGKIDRKHIESKKLPEIDQPKKNDDNFDSFSETERIVCNIWKEFLNLPNVRINDDFFEMGGDSLSAVQVCDAVGQQLGVCVPLGKIYQYRTIREFLNNLEGNSEDRDTSALTVPLNRSRNKNGAHLFCICGVYLYESLAALIGEEHQVSGIFLTVEEFAFKENGALPSLEIMATMYLDAIRKVRPKGPYYLAGLSFGGLLAYEIARQLNAEEESVRLLAMFDAMLPDSVSFVDRLKAHLKIAKKHGLKFSIKKIFAFINKKCKGLNEPEFLDVALVGEKRDLAKIRGKMYDKAASDYRKNMPCYNGDALFFRAAERSEFREITDRPDCGWKKKIMGNLQTFEIDGNHISMLEKPNVEKAAKILKAELDSLTRYQECGPMHPRMNVKDSLTKMQ